MAEGVLSAPLLPSGDQGHKARPPSGLIAVGLLVKLGTEHATIGSTQALHPGPACRRGRRGQNLPAERWRLGLPVGGDGQHKRKIIGANFGGRALV